mmetsp:Transcript_17076/g.59772  ORF Transcript_17076/g.59772 Transcript_17076/m.59772 type:complete len:302 (+) Transcript_17076:414-1319(+)
MTTSSIRQRIFSCMFNLRISGSVRPEPSKKRPSACFKVAASAALVSAGSNLHACTTARRISRSESGPASSAKAAAAAEKAGAMPRNRTRVATTSGSAEATSSSRRMRRHCSSNLACTTSSMRKLCFRTSRSSGSKMFSSPVVVAARTAPAAPGTPLPPMPRPYAARRCCRRRETLAASWSRGSKASNRAMRGRCCSRAASASKGGPAEASDEAPATSATAIEAGSRRSRKEPTAALNGVSWPAAQKPPEPNASKSSTVQMGSAWPCRPPGANICRKMSASSWPARALSKNEAKPCSRYSCC